MPRPEVLASINAYRWLCDLSLPAEDVERQLQRLLALQAVEVVAGRRLPTTIGMNFARRRAAVPPFEASQFRGDPVLALSVYAALRARRIQHGGLADVVSSYAAALTDCRPAPEAELALVVDLLRRCGFRVAEPQRLKRTISTAVDLVRANRIQTLETCRLITMITACGTRCVNCGNLVLVLPHLCVHYCTDWDIGAVSKLLRACAYLGVSRHPACRWALKWLLDQQQTDGRCGLLAPEARHLRGRDHDDWRLYFYPTVETLWTLVEMERPGFLLSN